MEDRCVICGEIIPEGTWVCGHCLNGKKSRHHVIMESISREVDLFAYKHGKYPERIFASHPVAKILESNCNYPLWNDYTIPNKHKNGLIGLFEGIPASVYYSPEYEFYLSGDKDVFYNISDNDKIFVIK